VIEVLEELAEEVGIRGAMLVATDGFPISSTPVRGVDQDTVAAIASAVLKGLVEGMEGLGMPSRFSQFVMTTAHGRLVFVDTDSEAYIIAITDKSLNLEATLLNVYGAAHRIRKLSELTDVTDEGT
jgi:predicted regulator of Ras-like GTPase activity (Roadblock/LC7/MglB family)